MTTIKTLACLGLLVALAACGADGAPTRPDTTPAQPPSVSISGEGRLGVSGTL